MDSNEFIILLFNRMAGVPKHDVAIFVQEELIPGVMGEVYNLPPYYEFHVSFDHATIRNPLIEAKIRQLYDLQPGDMIRIIPGEIYNNLIKYEICRMIGPGNFQAVIRPRKAGGRRRSTRKTKRRTTRRLKRKRVYYSTL